MVDATGQLLLNVLKFRPFLIKPNREELEELSGRALKGEKEIILACKDLQVLGACNILVSLGGDGAILVSETGGVYQSAAPQGRVVNTVGAGDSMVAGFLAGYLKNRSLLEAFHTGIAAGSASAFSEDLATGKEVSALLKTIKG